MKESVLAGTGIFFLGKGLLFGSTVYVVCQVIADRITDIWSPNSGVNGDIMQKFKALFDVSLTVPQQVTEGMEIVTYLVTPVAFYSALGLIVGAVSMIISWNKVLITNKVDQIYKIEKTKFYKIILFS